MKIAFFHLAFLYSGGGEKLALKQVELLREKGYTVDCFAPLVDNESCYPEFIQKIPVKEILPGTTRIFKNKPELGVIFICLVFPFIAYRFKHYDIIFGANQPGPLLGFIMKVLFHKPYIAYIAQPTRIIYRRTIDKQEGLQIKKTMRFLPHFFNVLRPFLYWIDLKSIFCANSVLTNGEYMQDVLKNIYSVNPIICSPGAITNSETSIAHSLTINTITINSPYILVSNRHVPHKKFEYALEVLDKMTNKLQLVITGEPTDYTTRLKKLVCYYNLNAYVHFLEYVSETDLDKLYQNCTLYLYTAPEEDFGMGVVEAMGYGKPVIAWNHAGPSKIITHGYDGFLVNFKDTTEVLGYINLLLKNQQIYQTISENARITVQNNYSWQKNAEIMATAINEAIPAEIALETNISTSSIFESLETN